MKHKPIPWAIALTGALYYGLLIYWQSDELSSGSGDAFDALVSVSWGHVGAFMACFSRSLPIIVITQERGL